MGDHPQAVCQMCGDEGCPYYYSCSNPGCGRLQHGYCGNYKRAGEELKSDAFLCDWCIPAGQQTSSPTHAYNSSYSSPINNDNNNNKRVHADGVTRSAYSGGKIKKHHHHQEGGSFGRKRKYKRLKDVLKNST